MAYTLTLALQFRPHSVTPLCWCRPREIECECGEHSIYAHRYLEPRPDVQPRMAVYSME